MVMTEKKAIAPIVSDVDIGIVPDTPFAESKA